MATRTRSLRSRGAAIVATALLVLTILSVINVNVNAIPLITDQQCNSLSSSWLDGIGTHEPAGQLFRPMHSSMVGFSIFIRSLSATPTQMTANIRLGGIGGAVLASYQFSVPAYFGSTNGAWASVEFPSGVQLTPGSTYALDLVDNTGSSAIKWNACSSAYSAGCGYSNGFCSTGAWAFVEYAGDFTVGLSSSSLTVLQGSSGSVQVFVSSVNNFASPVTLTLTTTSGVISTFNANPVTPTAGVSAASTLAIFVPGSVSAGVYPLTITGASGPIGHDVTLSLTVISSGASDFSVTTSPTTVAVAPGTTATTTVIVTSYDGFSSAVSLSAAWSGTTPNGVSLTLPSPITPSASSSASSTLSIGAAPGASVGTYILRITGTSGASIRSTDLTLVVAPGVTTTTVVGAQDFSVASSENTVSMLEGLSGSTTIVVTSINGFNSPVTLTASWVGNAPSGVTYALPSPITPPPYGAGSSPMAITSSSSASTGSFTLRIAGASGANTHTTDIIVQINQAGPRCVIATATYGSELAPEVLLLRTYRDEGIMKTQAGSNFMLAFNAWYYSFSPTVANYLTLHSAERNVMKAALYPLVGILAISDGIFHATSSVPEAAVILSGLVASSLIGAVYLGVPLSVLRARIRRLRESRAGKRLELALGIVLVAGLAALAAAEIVGSPALLMVSSAVVVLSALFASAAITSAKLSKLWTK